jgi:hypothetical protein
MNADLQALADRIQQLETTNRRWRRLGIAAVALAGVAALASMRSVVATVCNTVYAERFVLQDARGNERARITAYETNGLPQFTLHDQKGRKALSFGVAEDGRGYIEVAGADGKPVRSHFAVAAEGNATIEVPGAAKGSCDSPCQKKVEGGSSTN